MCLMEFYNFSQFLVTIAFIDKMTFPFFLFILLLKLIHEKKKWPFIEMKAQLVGLLRLPHIATFLDYK